MPESGAGGGWSAEQFLDYLRETNFFDSGNDIEIEKWEPGAVRIRMRWNAGLARPGGTVSGPAQFGLADLVMWCLVIGVDPDGADAVTTDMNMHFLRAVGGKDIIGDGRLLRSGRKLAVAEVTIFADGEEEPLCHTTGTYAFRRGRKQQ